MTWQVSENTFSVNSRTKFQQDKVSFCPEDQNPLLGPTSGWLTEFEVTSPPTGSLVGCQTDLSKGFLACFARSSSSAACRGLNSEQTPCVYCVLSGAVALHKSQIQSQEEELQELWDCHSEPVQGTKMTHCHQLCTFHTHHFNRWDTGNTQTFPARWSKVCRVGGTLLPDYTQHTHIPLRPPFSPVI